MQTWETVLLGLVEGLTEYLPVSSTGHLLAVRELLGIGADVEKELNDAFAIVIQSGAILAVLGLYRERVLRMFKGLAGRDAVGRDMARDLLVAFLPALVIGGLLDKHIERLLFGLWPVATAWIVGGAVILKVNRWLGSHEGLPMEALGPKRALLVGLMQCLAMWPGTSRSFATILGARLVGLALPAAVEFSFLLGVLTLGAATALKLLKHGGELVGAFGWSTLALGLVVAWLSAVVSVKWMVAWLQRHGMAVFGWWRLLAGVGVVGWLLLRAP